MLNSDTMFSANLTGLLPDVKYTLQVYPYNEAGEGNVDERNKTTLQERKSTATDGENDDVGLDYLSVQVKEVDGFERFLCRSIRGR